ncbi:MAG: VIT1/CCC1 transporter family protein, partial [Chloroflexi bacterium]|nr:VIT1/CCC1 transporter family protein [Chloroflexota bacterium]
LLFRTHVEKELGLRVEEFQSPGRNAAVMGFSFIVAALIPILPYLFLAASAALYLSVAFTVLALFGIGIGKAQVASRSYWRSGLEVVGIGLAAAGATYALGTFLPRLFGHGPAPAG